jgi:hypothetical protein
VSVEATGWAFRQNLPAQVKLLLVVLADQTDERSGRVCYGRTDIGHLAKKASLRERSVYRYLPALERNGYLVRESGAARGAPSEFWLRLDREPTPLDEWSWRGAEEQAL